MVPDKTYLKQVIQGSPCKGVCDYSPDSVCSGCGRTTEEAENWSEMSEKAKRIVWVRLIKDGYPQGVHHGYRN